MVLLVPWDPVPGPALEPVSVESLFSAEEVARAQDYARQARLLSLGSLLLSVLTVSVLGLTRLGPALVRRLPGPWWCQSVLAVTALLLAVRLVTLPLSIASWRLRLRFGLSTQDWQQYATDVVLGEAVAVVSTGVVVLVLLGCARRWPRLWPAIAGALLAGLTVAVSFVYPVVVEPLFHEFTPMPSGQLRTEITRVARDQGVGIDDVVIADASRRTTTLNAWVSGIGSTRRVVLYDTLLVDATQPQVVSVVAHELAHARNRDVLTGTTMAALAALAGTGLLGLALSGRMRSRLLRGEHEPGLPASAVPMLVAVLTLASLAVAPVQNAVSRRVETRADVGALESTQDPVAFVALQQLLARRSLTDPEPPVWTKWLWGSHPHVRERVALAERLFPE